MYTFNHFNFNVTDLDRSLAFYKQALGLEPVGKNDRPEDGGFVTLTWEMARQIFGWN